MIVFPSITALCIIYEPFWGSFSPKIFYISTFQTFPKHLDIRCIPNFVFIPVLWVMSAWCWRFTSSQKELVMVSHLPRLLRSVGVPLAWGIERKSWRVLFYLISLWKLSTWKTFKVYGKWMWYELYFWKKTALFFFKKICVDNNWAKKIRVKSTN